MLRRWCDQVIALTASKLKKAFGNYAAHRMAAPVVLICVTFTVSVPPSHRITRAVIERLAEHVEAWVHDSGVKLVADEGLSEALMQSETNRIVPFDGVGF